MRSSSARRLCLLGSTGSVGESTLDVLRQHPSKFNVVGLACGNSVEKLKAQIEEFSPEFVSLANEDAAKALRDCLSGSKVPQIFVGVEGHRRLVEECQPDIVMASMSGTHGLQACLQAIKQNVQVLGVANKEILVMAGKFIRQALESSSTALLPVDSEHSAIFQALQGNRRKDVKKIILTASGGPFRNWPISDFEKIKPADALKHPNWTMGAKITVDSASLMNKGLEFIEAVQLFQLKKNEIEVLVHPQSVIHSMVEYCDSSIMAQLGISDMRIPIAYALAFPERMNLQLSEAMDFAALGSLSFEKPDFEKFPCLQLAIDSLDFGAAGPIALNAANEVAVESFLAEEISFLQLPDLISEALNLFSKQEPQSLQDAVELDENVKSWTLRQIQGENKIKVQKI